MSLVWFKGTIFQISDDQILVLFFFSFCSVHLNNFQGYNWKALDFWSWKFNERLWGSHWKVQKTRMLKCVPWLNNRCIVRSFLHFLCLDVVLHCSWSNGCVRKEIKKTFLVFLFIKTENRFTTHSSCDIEWI